MNTNDKSLEEDKKYKELEEEYNRLKLEIKKLGEKYKELEEENKRLNAEIIKFKNIQNILEEKNNNEKINEISNSKLEEKENSINISFNPNKTENSQSLFSISNVINDDINSISFNSTDVAIKKIISYSFLNDHFICLKCNQVPRIEFIDLKKFNYTCGCHEDKNIEIDKIKEKSIAEFENDKDEITKYLKCQIHHKKYHYYCKYCNVNLCRECLSKKTEHRYHSLYLFDLHIFETNEIIYNIYKILNDDSKNLNMENIEYNIIEKILFLFSVIVKDFTYYPNYSHFKIFQNTLTFFKTLFSKSENNKIIESLEIEKKLIITYKKSLEQNMNNIHSIIEININRSNINDLSEICKLDLINLEKLSLHENCISDIKPLINAKFKNIKVIDLGLNKLGDNNIPHLFKLKFEKLEELNLYSNYFTDPSIFGFKNDEKEDNLPNLEIFYLGSNKIDWKLHKEKINNYNFNKLKTIGLTCGLFDEISISNLQYFNFKNLEQLYLSRNNIYSLSFVENLELPNIKEFYINTAFIKEFDQLKKYKTLEVIGLRENCIINIDNLELFVEELPKLTFIGLERNDIDMNEEKNKNIIDSIHKNKNGRKINIPI